MRALAAFCLFAMVVVTCADIVGRAFGAPIFGSEEIASFLLTGALALSLPFTHLEKAHVGVEIVFRLLPVRARVVLTLVTGIFSLLLMALITVMMYRYFAATRESGEVSMNLEFPEYWVILILAFGFFVVSGFMLRDVIPMFRIRESTIRLIEEEEAGR